MHYFALPSFAHSFAQLRKSAQVFLQLCCIAVLLPISLLAQSGTATLSGTIADVSGALVPNVSVTIINQDTGVSVKTQTNRAGIYSVPGLNPGRYQVIAEKRGFKQVEVRNLTLNVQDVVSRNFALEVGGTSETVQVDGSGVNINTTDASVSTVVDRKFVENLPLNGRSFQDLILLTPGVVTNSPQSKGTSGNTGEFSVNGQRTESNVYTVDGVTANTGGYIFGYGTSGSSGNLPAATALGTTQSLISVDALQEFRVASSSYSAEYGLSPGGQFSFATRSGTNQIHGTAFDYLRNNYFDANDWFNNNLGKAASAERQNDFGGTFGGPVWIPRLYDGKNKSFFFFSYEGLRLTQPTAASIQYVPSISLRQMAPAVLQPALNAFPIPTGSPLANGLAPFVEPYSLPSTIDSTSVRFDQQVSPKYKVFFRFSDTQSAAQTRTLSTITSVRQSSFTDTLGLTAALSSRVVNEFRLGYTANNGSNESSLDTFGGAQPADLLQMQGIAEPDGQAAVGFYPQGYSALVSVAKSVQPQHAWDTVDAITIAGSRQTFKVGFEYRETASRLQRATPMVHSYFNSVQAIIANSAYTAGTTVYGLSYPAYTNTSLYLQDELRLNQRLNLSFGLRWEVNPPPTQTSGTLPYIVEGDPSNPSTLTLAPANTRFWNTTYLNFAPRAGIAYQVHNQPGLETVFRAGGGVFFDSGQQDSTKVFGNAPGQSVSASYANVKYPLAPAQVYLPLAASPISPYGTGYYFPKHLQLPYTLQWNVALEQALGKDQSVTFSYVGANGRRLLSQNYLQGSAAGPNFSYVYLNEAGATSSYNSMQVKFQRRLSKGLQVLASYNWAHSIDFGSQSIGFSWIRGNSDYDVRNNLNLGATYDVHVNSSNRLIRATANQWSIDTRLIARTAFPVSFQGSTVSLPNGIVGYTGLNRKAGVPIYLYGPNCPNLSGGECPGGRLINPAAFSLPSSGQEGNAPRNFVRGFGENQVDLAVRRSFSIVEGVSLQFRAETFNIVNHPNFGSVQATYGNAQFGQATQMLNQSLGNLSPLYQQGGPRSMQFALKLIF